eukprot:jgi/Ulvmu1/6889/UM031_0095.1
MWRTGQPASYQAAMLVDIISGTVENTLVYIIKTALSMYKMYRVRRGDRQTFAMFMKNVAHLLEGIKENVPERAAPVVRELATLVDMAFDKLTKYDARGAVSSIWHVRSEADRMHSIMKDVQQLLPLLTASFASANNVSAAVGELQQRAASLDSASGEAAAHLSHLCAMVESLANSAATAADTQDLMTTLRDSMLRLHEQSTQTVLEGCAALQVTLGEGLERVVDAVENLHVSLDSFSRQMLDMQHGMQSDIAQIKRDLAQLVGMPAAAADSMESARILSALDELGEETGVQQPQQAQQPASSHQWAQALTGAIVNGRLSVTACLVLGVPLMPEGPLRPVTLPCCGFVVSHIAAQQMLQERRCRVCRWVMDPGAALEDNEAVAMVVAAETHGFAPRLLRSSQVTLGEGIGAGGEGTVQHGRLGDKPVAVKRVRLPEVTGAKEVASVKQVVAASYVAGITSPHVCKLHGHCWTDTELWLLMELCEGPLSKLVLTVKQHHDLPGLPPLDVVNLGLMLCSALDAVHRSARCLHLDVTPGNVLLTYPQRGGAQHSTAQHGPALRSARLCDFGLAKRLPTSVQTSLEASLQSVSVQGVGRGMLRRSSCWGRRSGAATCTAWAPRCSLRRSAHTRTAGRRCRQSWPSSWGASAYRSQTFCPQPH